MALTTPTVLTKRLSNGWVVEVNAGTTGTPNWLRVNGINEVSVSIEGTEQDVTDFDSGGWASTTTTLRKWSASIKAWDGYTGSNVDDPAQAELKARGLQVGAAAKIPVRFYRPDNGNKGYQGVAVSNYKGFGGGATAPESYNCDLGGDGALVAVTAS